ncbi:FAD-dependent oxidoreductase, partial [Corynebacterium striatum]
MSTTTPQNAQAEHFDLIIIGTGSGNSIPSEDFENKKIAIVEEGTFGGTCLNVGCIPTKMYVYAADLAYAAKEGQRLGIDAQVNNVDWQSIIERVFVNRIDKIAEGGEAYRRGDETPNITVFDKHATFVGPKTIAVGDDVITGDQIVIAAGSRPTIPEVYAESGVKYYTNEDIMRMPKQPKSLIIVGGGYIAMEFAHVFDGLGTKVTVVNRSEKLLRHLDEDIVSRFNEIARERFDVRIANGTQLTQNDSGVSLSLDDGSTVEAEAILVATGRKPNADLLGLDSAGIELREDG